MAVIDDKLTLKNVSILYKTDHFITAEGLRSLHYSFIHNFVWDGTYSGYTIMSSS